MPRKDPKAALEYRKRYWASAAGKANRAKQRVHSIKRFGRLRDARRREVAALLAKLKAAPCTDCGKSYPAPVMEFDHLPGQEKKREISKFRTSSCSIESLLIEVSKCELVCANCHRIRTMNRPEYGTNQNRRDQRLGEWLFKDMDV